MRITVVLLAIATTLPCQFGCGLRKVAATPAAVAQTGLPAQVKDKRIAVAMGFDATKVKGGHHEGLLQVRQPWMMGLKAEQKHLLFDNAGKVAALAFSAELQNQGLVVNPEGAEFTLGGTVQVVTLNTYGHGSKEGWGSAGNYWEATVEFTNLRLTDNRTGHLLWEGAQDGYARLTPCPLHMDWGILKILATTMQVSLSLTSTGTFNPMAVKNASDALDGSYRLEEVAVTPIDVASRLAAVAMLAKVPWPAAEPTP